MNWITELIECTICKLNYDPIVHKKCPECNPIKEEEYVSEKQSSNNDISG